MMVLFVPTPRQPVEDPLFPAQKSEKQIFADRTAAAKRVRRKRALLSLGLRSLRQWQRTGWRWPMPQALQSEA